MSEQDRGAYTPPREQPLAFDARSAQGGARGARPMPMTLIASGVVLVVLIGGVIMAYVGGFHGKDEPNKAVGDKVVSMKTAAAPGQAAPSDAPGKLEVFSGRSAASTAPAFAAGPEQPAERPKPQLQVQASTLPPIRIATGDEPAVPEAKPLTPAAVAAATAHPGAAKPVTTAAAPAKPATAAASSAKPATATSLALKPAIAAKPVTTATAKPVTTATAAKPATAAATTTGGVGAQIGAFSSKELADQQYAALGKLVSTAGHGKRVEPVAHGTATLYRTTVTGFADRDAAKAFCETLTAKGHACIVKG